jgi:hypothetical protein
VLRVDADALHGREVDHQAAIADGVTRDVMTATANGNQESVGSSKIDGMNHISSTSATGNERGTLIDHGVPN